jgi:hypothetical protein
MACATSYVSGLDYYGTFEINSPFMLWSCVPESYRKPKIQKGLFNGGFATMGDFSIEIGHEDKNLRMIIEDIMHNNYPVTGRFEIRRTDDRRIIEHWEFGLMHITNWQYDVCEYSMKWKTDWIYSLGNCKHNVYGF